MLVLTRFVGETISIGSDIKITVRALSNGVVSIGVKAPRSVAVHREEIYRKIREDDAIADELL